MMPRNKLGVLANSPMADEAPMTLVPPLVPDRARELQRAFLADLLDRLAPVKAHVAVYGAADPSRLPAMPRPWPVVPLPAGDIRIQMQAAFDNLLGPPDTRAVLIGPESPDVPLAFIKRAFHRLKHHDVVIGPALNGGCYLVGLRAPVPALLAEVEWESRRALSQAMDIIARDKLGVHLLPPWYCVNDARTLDVLRALCAARRVAGGVRLPHTERALSAS
jgi:glycosyltransferase A (GT-A) superfamily protein (DUF2064 family)